MGVSAKLDKFPIYDWLDGWLSHFFQSRKSKKKKIRSLILDMRIFPKAYIQTFFALSIAAPCWGRGMHNYIWGSEIFIYLFLLMLICLRYSKFEKRECFIHFSIPKDHLKWVWYFWKHQQIFTIFFRLKIYMNRKAKRVPLIWNTNYKYTKQINILSFGHQNVTLNKRKVFFLSELGLIASQDY